MPTSRPDHPASDNGLLLITYGDSIGNDHDAPLKVLHQFLTRHIGADLGVVHLLPFYPSSSDDGFAVIDYRMVDHHLGGWEDVQRLAGDWQESGRDSSSSLDCSK